MRKQEAQEYFKKLGGREGIAQRILEIAKQITEVDSYKRAVAGAGQIAIYAEIADKADEYWSEMVGRGATPEKRFLNGAKKFELLPDGNIDFSKLRE